MTGTPARYNDVQLGAVRGTHMGVSFVLHPLVQRFQWDMKRGLLDKPRLFNPLPNSWRSKTSNDISAFDPREMSVWAPIVVRDPWFSLGLDLHGSKFGSWLPGRLQSCIFPEGF